MKRILLFLAASALLIPSLRRFYRAWTTSPLDRLDGIFFILAMILIAFLLLFSSRNDAKKQVDPWAFPLVALFLLGSLFSFYLSLNTVCFWMLLAFLLALIWALWGWHSFWIFLPAGVLAALSAPSSGLSTLLPSGVFVFHYKIVAAAGFIAFSICNRFLDLTPRIPDGLFYLSGLFFLVVSSLMIHDIPSGSHFELRSDLRKFDTYLGAEEPLSDFDKRFFAGSRAVERRVYWGQGDSPTYLSTLKIISGDNVHNIHPATVCLRSAGWTIRMAEPKLLTIRDVRLSLEEILAEKDGKLALYYVWYSDGDISTGSYLKFRRTWRPGRVWHVYQVMTPIVTDLPAAEALLNEYLKVSRQTKSELSSNEKKHNPERRGFL